MLVKILDGGNLIDAVSWNVGGFILGISVAVFVASLLAAIIMGVLHRKKSIITPFNVFLLGVFISSFLFYIPLYWYRMAESGSLEGVNHVTVVLSSFQHALRIFAPDGDFREFVTEIIVYEDIRLAQCYHFFGSILYLIAPVLTLSVILSFVKNIISYIRYAFNFRREKYIFSELNEKTMALAQNIANTRKKSKTCIVFTDVIDKREELNLELVEQADKMNAILFRKDLDLIKFRLFNKKFKPDNKKLNFYLISEDEAEKIRHVEAIIKKYDDENVTLNVFSDDIGTALFLSSLDRKNIDVIRINDVQMLVYHELDKYGKNLFIKAREENNDTISVAIVGMGRYGTEMLKALIWFCQIENFNLKITAFDQDPNAQAYFYNMCPEIEDFSKSTGKADGEMRLDLTIHSGIDVKTREFAKKLEDIKDITFAFISLGDDDTNLTTAEKIRVVFEGLGKNPDIETVVYNPELSKNMGVTRSKLICNEESKRNIEYNQGKIPRPNYFGAKNHKGEPFNILTIGDLDKFYSLSTLFDDDLVKKGMLVHTRWDTLENEKADTTAAEKAFKRYEYFYRSSIAKAIAENLRSQLVREGFMEKIPSFKDVRAGYVRFAAVLEEYDPEKPDEYPVSIKPEEKEEFRKLYENLVRIAEVEHIRWNAYMRTEGYVFGESRNDLAKRHNNLVATHKLPPSTLIKDAI